MHQTSKCEYEDPESNCHLRSMQLLSESICKIPSGVTVSLKMCHDGETAFFVELTLPV